MGIFGINPNEVAYVGGKKHWTDVIKNSGSGDLLIWRQPEEDFNTNSTLIVMPGEQAFFVNGGVVEQVFKESGTYKLTTNNYPFISRLRNAFSGGISTFNCVVYFLRKAHSAEIFWGTSSPIQVRDKLLGVATKVKARGSYKIEIENPVLFLEKLVGNNIPFQTQEDLNRYFMNEFQMEIRSVLTQALNDTETELLGIEGRIKEFSGIIEPSIQEMLSEYGLKCIRFVIAALEVDDDELRRKYDEIGMDNIAKIREAQADMAVMTAMGDNWQKLQAAQILRDLANNPGAGGIAAGGAGIGLGVAAAGVFGGMAQQLMTPMNVGGQQTTPQPVQQQATPSGRFSVKSNVANSKDESSSQNPIEVLSQLKQMLDLGLIDKSVYDAKVTEILSRM